MDISAIVRRANYMSIKIERSLTTVVKGAGIIFFGGIVAQLFGMVNQILLGRFLGPEKYGLFNLGLSIILICSMFAMFGLGAALSQFIPVNIIKRNAGKVYDSIRFSFKFVFGVGISLSIILFIFSNVIATKIFRNDELSLVIRFLSVALPFTAFYRFAESVPRGFKKAKYKVYVQDMEMQLLKISIFLVLIFLGYKLLGAIAAYLCSVISASVIYLYLTYHKFLPSLDSSFHVNKKRYSSVKKELISLTWPLFLAGFTYLILGHTDRILLGVYMSTTDVGIYVAAFFIASLTISIAAAFSFIFLPVISEYFAERDISGISDLFSTVTKWVFLLTFPIVIYLILYGKDVIRLIYGDPYLTGSSALTILSVGIAMFALTGMAGSILIAITKTKLNLLSEIIGAVSNIILNILLIPRYGIMGAAIGTSVSISLRNISSLGFVYRELKIHPYDINYIKIVVISVISLVLLSFVFKTYTDFLWSFLIIIPIFLTIYLIFLLITGCLDETDKSFIKTLLKKVKIRK